ncbi:MAG: FliO/MopB family protein [Spirochaetia bacterium]
MLARPVLFIFIWFSLFSSFFLGPDALALFAQTPDATPAPIEQPLDETQFLLGTDPATVMQDPLAPPRQSALVSFGAGVRAFFVLALVLALAYFFLRFLRKLSGQEIQQSSVIKVMASQTLKGQASVHIIEVADSLYLLGVGDSVNLISEITDKDAIDQLKLELTRQQANPQGFAQLLRTKLAINGADPGVKTVLNTDQHADRLRQLLDDKKDSQGSTQA